MCIPCRQAAFNDFEELADGPRQAIKAHYHQCVARTDLPKQPGEGRTATRRAGAVFLDNDVAAGRTEFDFLRFRRLFVRRHAGIADQPFCRRLHSTQFSIVRSGIPPNSPTLAVTNVVPREEACAALRRLLWPMVRPSTRDWHGSSRKRYPPAPPVQGLELPARCPPPIPKAWPKSFFAHPDRRSAATMMLVQTFSSPTRRRCPVACVPTG